MCLYIADYPHTQPNGLLLWALFWLTTDHLSTQVPHLLDHTLEPGDHGICNPHGTECTSRNCIGLFPNLFSLRVNHVSSVHSPETKGQLGAAVCEGDGLCGLHVCTDIHKTSCRMGQPVGWREGSRAGNFPCAGTFWHRIPNCYRILNSNIAFQVIMKAYLSRY